MKTDTPIHSAKRRHAADRASADADAATPQLAQGSLFAARFEIEAVAGAGGMGTVYRARDRDTAELVALKLLRTGPSGPRGKDVRRFAREAALLRELRHPGIVAYVAHGETSDGQCFLAMEWLCGHDLAARLGGGPLAWPETLAILRGAAMALAFAHQRGVIHRDLKPSKITSVEKSPSIVRNPSEKLRTTI